MFYPNLDFNKDYLSGPSSGTSAVSGFRLEEDNTLIGIESVAMFSGRMFLRAAPGESPEVQQRHERVLRSIEQSLEENAAVWGELSKY